MATEIQSRPTLSPAIESLLARLRTRIRAYVWAEGIAVVLVVLGAAFWASLAFDWVFEPPVALRIGLQVAMAALLSYVVFRYILHRAFVRLANRSMAVVLERRFDRFNDSLLTTVELTEHSPEVDDDYSRDMFAHTQQEALAGTADVPLKKVFNFARLARRISLGVVLVASVVTFGVLASESFGVWARRSLLLSDELWPRRTHLHVERFDENPILKVARGGDVTLVVRAETGLEQDVPETVEVRTLGADRRREKMNREGAAERGQDEFQLYAYKFKSVLESIEFYVTGGDDRHGPFKLEVVDSPMISNTVLHCTYPAYMNRAPRDIPTAAITRIPIGTEITIHAQANKDLVELQINELADEGNPLVHQVELNGPSRKDFEFKLPALTANKTLSFTLLDTDGIRSRGDANKLILNAVPDEPPQLGVQLKGIGSAITPSARLPVVGEILDDYGVARGWFDFHVDDGAGQQQPFKAEIAGQDKILVNEALEVRDLKLEPKQKFHFAVQAADNYALADQPHVGTTPRYVLEVVTPERLRSMMESRELVLRHRFEVIIQELTDTRDLLARIDFGKLAGESADASKPADEIKDGEKKDAEKKDGEKAPEENSKAGSSDKDKDGDDAEARSPERQLSLRRVQIERVLQNSERSAHETLALAVAFDDIREELINNRVDTEELKSRLKEGIADPLRGIVEKRFPELESRVKKLGTLVTDPQTGRAQQAQARDEADLILVEMRQVLDKMVELETFNEALDLLRDIIAAQEKLQEATAKEKLKGFGKGDE